MRGGGRTHGGRSGKGGRGAWWVQAVVEGTCGKGWKGRERRVQGACRVEGVVGGGKGRLKVACRGGGATWERIGKGRRGGGMVHAGWSGYVWEEEVGTERGDLGGCMSKWREDSRVVEVEEGACSMLVHAGMQGGHMRGEGREGGWGSWRVHGVGCGEVAGDGGVCMQG